MRNFLSHRQGFSGIEFLLSAIPVLLLGLGSYEITRWYNTRHVLNLALIEAARTGSVHHAKPEDIEASFEQALSPLFAGKGDNARQAYLQKIERMTQYPAWRIRQQSPTHAHFMDFHRDDLAIAKETGHYAIDNNYQKEQHTRKGKGLLSQSSIYEANTLSLSLSYAYEPVVPGIKFLFKQLRHFYTDPYAHTLLSHGFLPIQHHISISMQSHPVQWPGTAKVITDYPHHVVRPTDPKDSLSDPCHGIWCHSSGKSPKKPSQTRPQAPHHIPKPPPSEANQPRGDTSHKEDTPPIPDNTSLPSKEHPHCRNILCCD